MNAIWKAIKRRKDYFKKKGFLKGQRGITGIMQIILVLVIAVVVGVIVLVAMSNASAKGKATADIQALNGLLTEASAIVSSASDEELDPSSPVALNSTRMSQLLSDVQITQSKTASDFIASGDISFDTNVPPNITVNYGNMFPKEKDLISRSIADDGDYTIYFVYDPAKNLYKCYVDNAHTTPCAKIGIAR